MNWLFLLALLGLLVSVYAVKSVTTGESKAVAWWDFGAATPVVWSVVAMIAYGLWELFHIAMRAQGRPRLIQYTAQQAQTLMRQGLTPIETSRGTILMDLAGVTRHVQAGRGGEAGEYLRSLMRPAGRAQLRRRASSNRA